MNVITSTEPVKTANTDTQFKTFEHHREKDLAYNYLIVSVLLRRERRSNLAYLKARTRQRIYRNTNRVSSSFFLVSWT